MNEIIRRILAKHNIFTTTRGFSFDAKTRADEVYESIFYEGDPLSEIEHFSVFNEFWNSGRSKKIKLPEKLVLKLISLRKIKFTLCGFEYLASGYIDSYLMADIFHNLALTNEEELILWDIFYSIYPYKMRRTCDDINSNLHIYSIVESKIKLFGTINILT